MKKRIKNHLLENRDNFETSEDSNKEEDFYVELLISDLKKVREMPKYSLWSEMVNKHLLNKDC